MMDELRASPGDLRRITAILARMSALNIRLDALTDRVGVIEHCTQSHESRLEDLETWQNDIDDKLED